MSLNRALATTVFGGSILAASFLTAAASATTTTANYVSTVGLESLGSFEAQVTYAYTSGSTASLTLSLTNTTLVSVGGYITAVAVTMSGASTVAGLTSCSDADFGYLSGPVTASPFGDYEGGASTSNSWLGGGAPSVGTGVGQTITFNFLVTGAAADLNSLNATTALSPVAGYGFVVRFRGMNGGGSDKVGGIVQEVVPAPGAFATLALGAICGAGRRRRQN